MRNMGLLGNAVSSNNIYIKFLNYMKGGCN